MSVPARKKYEMCKNFREKGECKYGDRCLFAHGDHELTRRGSPCDDKPREEAPKEDSIVVQDQTTLDTTKVNEVTQDNPDPSSDSLTDSIVETENLLKSDKKKLSSGSGNTLENASIEAILHEDDTQDQGEYSTTLSSLNSRKTTPEKGCGKIGVESYYSFKKEEEFKCLLDNLDIENIDIKLEHSQQEKYHLDIERLLREEDPEPMQMLGK